MKSRGGAEYVVSDDRDFLDVNTVIRRGLPAGGRARGIDAARCLR
jgi:hypothetical protein